MSKTKWTDEELIEAVRVSFSIRQTLITLGMSGKGGSSYNKIPKRIKELNLETSHFYTQLTKPTVKFKLTLEEILIKDSSYSNTTNLKRRLIKNNLLENKCALCGMLPFWNNKPLSLHLDHINGIRTDNRLENLRLLCPNCHSQTDTYCGKNIVATELSHVNLSKYICEKCGKTKKTKEAKLCKMCFLTELNKKQKTTKIVWPTKEELEKLVWEKPTLQIAIMFDVSDKAIEKRCKKFGISKPPRGYWATQKAKL